MTNKEKIEKWLDKQIKWLKKDSICKLNRSITLTNFSSSFINEVQIGAEAVNYISDMFGFETYYVPFNCEGSEYKWKKCFSYKEVTFFWISGGKRR